MFYQLLYSRIDMTKPITTHSQIFSSPKANLTQTQNFVDKVTKNAGVNDSRETGVASFKQVFNETKNNVHVEFEAPGEQKLSANIRPGHKNTLWSNA
jgi:hypothetical protein